MGGKSKGSDAERELIHAFCKNGWAAIRAAGSGASRYPSPDVLAGNGSRRIAVECKATGDDVKYLTAEEVEQLQKFSEIFGAEPWIGIRFNKMEWYFFPVDSLKKSSGNSFPISTKLAKEKGLKFEELIRQSTSSFS